MTLQAQNKGRQQVPRKGSSAEQGWCSWISSHEDQLQILSKLEKTKLEWIQTEHADFQFYSYMPAIAGSAQRMQAE